MFQFFRRRDTAVRVFIGAILITVCIMLVVTLIPGLTDTASSDEVVIARVGRDTIYGTEIMREVQQLARGSRLPPSVLPMYAPQVLNQMVMQKIVMQEARRMGLRVTQEELASQLASNPMFFPSGKFIGADSYRDYIQSRLNMTVPQFEGRFSDSLLLEKFRQIVTSGVTIAPSEVEREYHRRNDKLRFEYVLLKTEDVRKSLQVAEADVAAFFQKNRSRYQVPERRQFRFVYADTARLKDSVTVEEKDLQRFYNENKDRFRVQDRVKISHILLKTVGKNPQETEEVRKKAEDLLERLRKGGSFAALVKSFSEDAATTQKDGDLGWITRGQTVPELEKAAFALEPGALSDVIKAPYGFHIVKVDQRERAHQQTLDEVREQIVPQVKQEKAQAAAEEIARKAENALKRSPGNFQGVASELELDVLDSGLIKRGEPLPQAGSSPAAEDALFSSALKPNPASNMTGALRVPNGVVIAQLVQVSPAHAAELAEVRGQVENDLKMEKAGEETAARMQRLAEQVRQSGDLKKAAAAMKLEMKTTELVNLMASVADIGSISSLGDSALGMKVGEIGGPAAVTDGQVVYRMAEFAAVPAAEVAARKGELEQQLLDNKRRSVFEWYTDQLRQRLENEGKVKIDQAAMQRLTRVVE